MKDFHCSFITPQGKLFDDKVRFVLAPGAQGQFGVLADHAFMVANLQRGVLMLRSQDETEHWFVVHSGVLEVGEGHDVLILADGAVKAENEADARNQLSEHHGKVAR